MPSVFLVEGSQHDGMYEFPSFGSIPGNGLMYTRERSHVSPVRGREWIVVMMYRGLAAGLQVG